jgi:hypothetical protein
MLRAIPLLSVLVLLLSSPSQTTAALVSAAPASLPPATFENASTAFFEGGSESRIGLLCHNDPVNRVDPYGEEGWTDAPRAAWALGLSPQKIQLAMKIANDARMAGQEAHDEAKNNGTLADTPDIGNAVTHLVLAAELTRAFGIGTSEKLTDIHEDGAAIKDDSKVDQRHNALGRAIGIKAESSAQVRQIVKEVLKTDKVILKIPVPGPDEKKK